MSYVRLGQGVCDGLDRVFLVRAYADAEGGFEIARRDLFEVGPGDRHARTLGAAHARVHGN